jgi:hypothetical protein
MNMRRRIAGLIILIAAFISIVMAKDPAKTDSVPGRKPMSTDTPAPVDTLARKTVMIATGGSYLENAVVKILADSLSHRGIPIKTTDLQGLSQESSTSYAAVLVFGAVTPEKLVDPVNKFASGVLDGGMASNILFCTVYGDLWDPKKATIDAVTGPTKTLKPIVIAGKIMERLNRVFDRMPAPGKADGY